MGNRIYIVRYTENVNVITPSKIDRVVNIQADSTFEMFSELNRIQPDAYILTITKLKSLESR